MAYRIACFGFLLSALGACTFTTQSGSQPGNGYYYAPPPVAPAAPAPVAARPVQPPPAARPVHVPPASVAQPAPTASHTPASAPAAPPSVVRPPTATRAPAATGPAPLPVLVAQPTPPAATPPPATTPPATTPPATTPPPAQTGGPLAPPVRKPQPTGKQKADPHDKTPGTPVK